jgi:hypothetical protein
MTTKPCPACELKIPTVTYHNIPMQDATGNAIEGHLRLRCRGDSCKVCKALKRGAVHARVTPREAARAAEEEE